MPEAKTDALWNEQAFRLDFYNVWVSNQFGYKYEIKTKNRNSR